jgi:hypothetical protein
VCVVCCFDGDEMASAGAWAVGRVDRPTSEDSSTFWVCVRVFERHSHGARGVKTGARGVVGGCGVVALFLFSRAKGGAGTSVQFGGGKGPGRPTQAVLLVYVV